MIAACRARDFNAGSVSMGSENLTMSVPLHWGGQSDLLIGSQRSTSSRTRRGEFNYLDKEMRAMIHVAARGNSRKE